MMILILAAALAAAPPVERQLTAPGPLAPLAGTMLDAQARAGGGDPPWLGPD